MKAMWRCHLGWFWCVHICQWQCLVMRDVLHIFLLFSAFLVYKVKNDIIFTTIYSNFITHPIFITCFVLLHFLGHIISSLRVTIVVLAPTFHKLVSNSMCLFLKLLKHFPIHPMSNYHHRKESSPSTSEASVKISQIKTKHQPHLWTR